MPTSSAFTARPRPPKTPRPPFGVLAEKAAPDAAGNYLVNHTASVFLIGRDGSFEGTIAYGEDTKAALAKIQRLVEK